MTPYLVYISTPTQLTWPCQTGIEMPLGDSRRCLWHPYDAAHARAQNRRQHARPPAGLHLTRAGRWRGLDERLPGSKRADGRPADGPAGAGAAVRRLGVDAAPA